MIENKVNTYLNNIKTWTEWGSSSDAYSNQIRIVFRYADTSRCYSHSPGGKSRSQKHDAFTLVIDYK